MIDPYWPPLCHGMAWWSMTQAVGFTEARVAVFQHRPCLTFQFQHRSVQNQHESTWVNMNQHESTWIRLMDIIYDITKILKSKTFQESWAWISPKETWQTRRNPFFPMWMSFFEAPEEDGDSEDDLQVCGSPVAWVARSPWRFQLWSDIWVCLKMGYTPNEIAISKRDNDQQNHWVFRGTQHFQTNPYITMFFGG